MQKWMNTIPLSISLRQLFLQLLSFSLDVLELQDSRAALWFPVSYGICGSEGFKQRKEVRDVYPLVELQM
ncbi:hypothetical protein AB6A40_008113 [Gnathostoma spinigerum]|uniref:Uncharacterized protein n=1 Tax=Gnathostoma spinigerum TaxID=75299 RepID=A0ABD6EN46_9BILA